MLNDLMQSVVPAVYPILKDSYALDFGQIGLITFANQATASLLQPIVGRFTDAKPKPYSLAIGMTFTLVGLLLLSMAPTFGLVLAAVALRRHRLVDLPPGVVARRPDGLRRASRLRPVVLPGRRQRRVGDGPAARGLHRPAARPGQHRLVRRSPRSSASSSWRVSAPGTSTTCRRTPPRPRQTPPSPVPAATVRRSLAILVALVFSKNVYLASLTSFYTFYLIHKFGLSVQSAQLHLFILLAAVAAGTFFGGPVGDRIGRKYVIWVSILGVLPFTVALPYANLFWTELLTVVIGLVLASAFSAIVVFAQELVPGRVGTVSGIFFGFAFGAGAIGAALLGHLADATSIELVYTVCSFLPAIGLLTVFLPDIEPARKAGKTTLR